MKKHQLPRLIDWDLVMLQDRYAGGHIEVMQNIFGSSATVIAEYVRDDYQGGEAFAYLLYDGFVAIITDYFGSCSGCDSWSGATDADAKTMIMSLVNSARLFDSVEDAALYCEFVQDNAEEYAMHAAWHLTSQLEKFSIIDEGDE